MARQGTVLRALGLGLALLGTFLLIDLVSGGPAQVLADPNDNACPKSTTDTDSYRRLYCIYQQPGEYQHSINWDLYYGNQIPSKEDISQFVAPRWTLNDGGAITLYTSAGSARIALAPHRGDRCDHVETGNPNLDVTNLVKNNTWDYVRINMAPHGRCGVSGGNLDLVAYKVQTPSSFTLSGTSACYAEGSSSAGKGFSSGTPTPSNLLEWTASSRAEWYDIYRNSGPRGTYELIHTTPSSVPDPLGGTIYPPPSTTPTIPVTSYRDTGVTAGTTYSYWVSARNNAGTTRSNTHTITTVSSCGSSGGGSTSFSVTVSPSSVTLEPGQKQIFVATPKVTGSDTTLTFEEFSAPRQVSAADYSDKGVIFTSPSNGKAYLTKETSAACTNYPTSAPNWLHADPGPASPLTVKFLSGITTGVTDKVSFTLMQAGNAEVEIIALDANGKELQKLTKPQPGGGTCRATSVSLATPNIAELRFRKTTAGDTDGYGIDQFVFSPLHKPTTIAWSLKSGAGTISQNTTDPFQATFTAGNTAGTYADLIQADVTMSGSGTKRGTASVTIGSGAGQTPSVTVSPSSTTLKAGVGQQQFTARIDNAAPTETISFDDLPANTDVTTQYQSSGVTVSPAPGSTNPVIIGPGAPHLDCGSGRTEASSQPNFLVPEIGGQPGYGGMTFTFTSPVQKPGITLVSLGRSTATVTYTHSDGTATTETVPGDSGSADGACKTKSAGYSDDKPVRQLTVTSNEPVNGEDAYGVDDLTWEGASVTPAVGWSLTQSGAEYGSIDQTGLYTAGSSVRTHAGLVKATARIDGVDYSGTASVTITNATSGTVSGDIYARGNVGNLSVSADSVVSASGTVSVTGSSYTIGNYSRTAEESTSATIEKLKREKAVKLSTGDYTISGAFFNLNPKSGNPTSDTTDNAAKPEGGVWYVPGNLQIKETTIHGRGTIIVGGSVTLAADSDDAALTYAASGTPLLGIIAETGGINLTGFTEVNGAFYAPQGTITLGSGLTASGLFVGKSIALQSKDVAISYDGRITKSPPLGFSEAFVPALSEVTP
ncbi:hypothetical protein HY374_01325 [Candidatus Berkelbacteria bacterium]|nr:hypothetical protein [Candidatus Berkelbacteria bacterium]